MCLSEAGNDGLNKNNKHGMENIRLNVGCCALLAASFVYIKSIGFYNLMPGLVAAMKLSRGWESSQMTALVW